MVWTIVEDKIALTYLVWKKKKNKTVKKSFYTIYNATATTWKFSDYIFPDIYKIL